MTVSVRDEIVPFRVVALAIHVKRLVHAAVKGILLLVADEPKSCHLHSAVPRLLVHGGSELDAAEWPDLAGAYAEEDIFGRREWGDNLRLQHIRAYCNCIGFSPEDLECHCFGEQEDR